MTDRARHCVVCGINIDHAHVNATKCSEACRTARARELKNAGHKANRHARQCVVCKEEFFSSQDLAKVCSATCKRKLVRVRARERFARNPEKHRAKVRERYQRRRKVCPETVNEEKRRYYAKNINRERDRIRVAVARRRAQNPERYNEVARRWRTENREKVRAANLRAIERARQDRAVLRAMRELGIVPVVPKDAQTRARLAANRFKARKYYAENPEQRMKARERSKSYAAKHREVVSSKNKERHARDTYILKATRELQLV